MSDEIFLVPRPLQYITFAKESARGHLADQLNKEFQLEPQQAAALVRIIVDPTAARHQIANPLIKRFPGGIAKFLVADVFTLGVAASLINPRESSERPYPVAARPGEYIWPPITVEAASAVAPVLRLTANSPEHVGHIAVGSADRLRRRVALREAIALDGVLEPVTVVLAELRHRDGVEPVIIPIAVDGSTRTTLAHDLTGIDPVEAIYDLPRAPMREWRGKIGQILSVQDKPEMEVSEQEKTAHRALIYQARILVAVEPVRGGKPVDVVMACRAIVGGIHVGHPEEWPQGSELDEIAEAVLDQLMHDRKIKADQRQYISGLIDPADLEQRGFSPHPDERAAYIVRTLYNSRNDDSISLGYRSLVTKTKLARNDKSNIATELILRAVRTNLKASDVDAVRSALQRTIRMAELRNAWQVSGRSPDELLAAALHELTGGDGTIGPAQLELAVLGAYWLVTKRALRRETRGSVDTREGANIISVMLRSEHGLRQLYQAVIDGRADLQGDGPITAIDPKGKRIPLAGGGFAEVEDDWLRKTFPAPNSYSLESLSKEDVRRSPEGQLSQGVRDLQNLIDNLRQLVQCQERIAASLGVPEAITNDMADKLRHAADRIVRWGSIHAAKTSQVSFEDLEEGDLLEDLDEALA